ncbi:glycosyltransferase family 4 protein [Thermomicrobium sp. CFH 73360]|uniref:glycosyltransferase family 4 protein n=1 Tax=Thermomicrobium sp. CFH 73360 TaxID=2951987 RepID=UPI002076A8E4|nr:glycosyltransferase family 4 protein [Thermomicrobium sp. CFH 73360]MCM8745351.1 glycosyltransferase family 4 protein [Thermomicrobium sp. CFH 73360]
MRILIVSKALVNGVYQRKLEELARLPDVELLAVVPPFWHENRVGVLQLERRYVEGYQLVVEPMWFNGHHHVHFYPGLGKHIARFRPDILHIDEEPYNLVTAHAALLGRRYRARILFFTWQNLYRRYPPPFSWFEQLNYRLASAAVAGNHEAADVLRRKGFRGPLAVIPQFGVDPELFRPMTVARAAVPTIGFVGRLVPEKGADLLIRALAQLPGRVQLEIVGDGIERTRLELLATELGVRDRVLFRGGVPPALMPEALNRFDVLVVPSRTRRNWKEQFGRVIIEAMSCGVPVVGSSSGEIPHVIGDPSLVFPEDDVDALVRLLRNLLADPERRRQLGEAGRRRVLAHYTQRRIAEQYYAVYQAMLAARRFESQVTEEG